VAVAVPGQFLAKARRDEQHVVGSGAEQHDGHDPGGLPGDREIEIEGEPGGDGAGDLKDQSHAQERDRRHDRGSVDDDQQHQHQEDGHQQKQAVDVGEHPDQVHHQPAGSSHGNLHAGQTDGGRAVADAAHRVGERIFGRLAQHLHKDIHGGAVWRNQAGPLTHGRVGTQDPPHVVRRLGAGQPVCDPGRSLIGAGAEAGRVAQNDQNGCAGRRETFLRELECPGCLGVAG